MTVSVSTNKVSYAGNGSTTAFAFAFPITAEADLRVVLRDSAGDETVKTLTTHYTVSASPWASGGSITMLTAPASGETLLIKSQIAYTQGVDLRDGDALPAETLEGALDRNVRLIQQVAELSERAVTLQEVTALTGLTLPDPTAGTVLYSADGLTLLWGALSTLTGSPIVTPIAVIDGGTGGITAAAARTNLGEGAGGSFFTKLHAFGQTVSPTVTDDSGDGYSVGSHWYDITANIIYDCIDASVGAAIWLAFVTNSGPAFKNRITNGDARIDQRNAGAAVVVNTTANFFGADMWRGFGQAADGVFSIARSTATPPTGFSHFFRATITTADAAIGAGQTYGLELPIEGFNASDFAFGGAGAQTVTLSFRVRSSLTGAFSGALANAAGNRTYPFNYTINAANTWETKTVAIAGDTSGTWPADSSKWGRIYLDLGAGATFRAAASAWTATANVIGVTGAVSLIGTLAATLDITGVQLEPGSAATEFERIHYGALFARCQRYYEKSFEVSVVPGTATGVGQNGSIANSAGTAEVTCPFKERKRAAPTVTLYDPTSGATTTWRDGGGAARTPSVVNVAEQSFTAIFTTVTASATIGGNWIASAEL
jgi:hypothetical protein